MSVLPGHELVGAQLVGQLPSGDMVNLWSRVASGIVKYGFVIEYRDLDAVLSHAQTGSHYATDR
jgi:hypothetical protein